MKLVRGIGVLVLICVIFALLIYYISIKSINTIPTPYILLPLIIIIFLMLYTYKGFKDEKASKYMRIIITAIASLIALFSWWLVQLEDLQCWGQALECLSNLKEAVSPIRYFYLGLPILLIIRPKNIFVFLMLIIAYTVLTLLASSVILR